MVLSEHHLLQPEVIPLGKIRSRHYMKIRVRLTALDRADRLVPTGRVMSDTSQGPGWWQASDGKWYAPETATTPAPPAPPAAEALPMNAKSAKASAKAAQAHAKALRPWYKKKRFIGLGLVAILVIIIIAASSGSKSSTNGTSPTSGGGTTENAGCTKNPPSYPDQQTTHDCVALPDSSVSVANATVTATWAKAQDPTGSNQICAAVTIKNHNTSTISFNEFDFKLQSPSGKVEDAGVAFTNALNSGDIVGGGTTSGNICFDDPGQAGTYVGIYKPDPFSADRGIWLVPL